MDDALLMSVGNRVGDRVLTPGDADLLVSVVASDDISPRFDLDGDCEVTSGDLDLLLSEAEVLNGDVDFNGQVEFADFLVLSRNFNSDTTAWSRGDLAPDGRINFSDFLVLSNNFGQTFSSEDGDDQTGTASVPEPNTKVQFYSFGFVLLICRRLLNRTSRPQGPASEARAYNSNSSSEAFLP